MCDSVQCPLSLLAALLRKSTKSLDFLNSSTYSVVVQYITDLFSPCECVCMCVCVCVCVCVWVCVLLAEAAAIGANIFIVICQQSELLFI